MEGSSGANSRQAIALKKSKSSSDGRDSQGNPHKSKSGRKVVPLSFVEVIDKLLEVIYKFDPSKVEKPLREDKKGGAKDTDLGAGVVEGTTGNGEGANQSTQDGYTFPEMAQLILGGRRGTSNHLFQVGWTFRTVLSAQYVSFWMLQNTSRC